MSIDLKTKRVSLDFPCDLLEQIEEICKDNFISKRKWFIDAAKEKLENETSNKIDKIVRG
jgi:metal-responsive CopG/Arc/MetJ family transcriptional regulator